MTDEDAPKEPAPKRRKKGGGLSGESLGGMLAGFDQAVFRTTPPPHELVLKGSPVRGLSGEDAGSELIITLPGDDAAPAEDEVPALEGGDPAPESTGDG